jgi:hypothetical protein
MNARRARVGRPVAPDPWPRFLYGTRYAVFETSWMELADELCEKYPDLPSDVVLDELCDVIDSCGSIDANEELMRLARIMMRVKLRGVTGKTSEAPTLHIIAAG